MKTSILISGFAALCLMIAFAESPSHRGADKNNAGHVDRISFVPVNQANETAGNKIILIAKNTVAETTPLSVAEDFSYLKFNVADYINTGTDASTEPDALLALTGPYCVNLKFDVNDYAGNTEVTSFENIELPVNDLDYLRFDAEKYSEPNSDTFETMDLPGDNFSYLKFNVKDLADNAEISSLDDIELPVDDFTNLRFEVGKYLDINSDSYETMDLPSDNFTSLKFDVNKYTVGSDTEAGAIGELPVTEALSFSLL